MVSPVDIDPYLYRSKIYGWVQVGLKWLGAQCLSYHAWTLAPKPFCQRKITKNFFSILIVKLRAWLYRDRSKGKAKPKERQKKTDRVTDRERLTEKDTQRQTDKGKTRMDIWDLGRRNTKNPRKNNEFPFTLAQKPSFTVRFSQFFFLFLSVLAFVRAMIWYNPHKIVLRSS